MVDANSRFTTGYSHIWLSVPVTAISLWCHALTCVELSLSKRPNFSVHCPPPGDLAGADRYMQRAHQEGTAGSDCTAACWRTLVRTVVKQSIWPWRLWCLGKSPEKPTWSDNCTLFDNQDPSSSEIRGASFKIRDPNFEIRDPRIEIRVTKAEILDSKREIRDSRSEI